MNSPQLILWLGVVAPTPTDNFEVQSILRQVPQKQVKDQDFSCCCSVAQSCPTFCDPMDCSMPGFPVLHYLLELAQTHVHWVSDAIQPSHHLSFPSPPTFNPSQNQVFSNMSVLRMRCLKYWSFSVNINTSMNTQDWSPLGWTGWISLQPKGLSKVFSNTTVQKHHFFCAHVSLQSNSYIHTWPLDKA